MFISCRQLLRRYLALAMFIDKHQFEMEGYVEGCGLGTQLLISGYRYRKGSLDWGGAVCSLYLGAALLLGAFSLS